MPNHSNKSNMSNKSVNMSKLHDYACPCGYDMYVDYTWSQRGILSITISCECGFSWTTTFGRVSRVERQMVRRAIENFYNNHHDPTDCGEECDGSDHDGDSDFDPYE
jgi:hypothetical protein